MGRQASTAAGRPTIGWAAADYYSILNFAVGNLGSSQEGRRCRAGAAGRLASTSAGLFGARRLLAPDATTLATGVLGARRALSSDATALAAAVLGARRALSSDATSLATAVLGARRALSSDATALAAASACAVGG